MPNFISEDQIKRALVQNLQNLHGFDSLDCHPEDQRNTPTCCNPFASRAIVKRGCASSSPT